MHISGAFEPIGLRVRQPYRIPAPFYAGDPYPVYARLRDEDPVHCSPFMAGSYVLSRYDDVSGALRDHERFSSNPLGAEVGGHRFLIGSDPPDHTKLRRLVTKFTPSAIAAMEPRIRQICNQLVDELIDHMNHLGSSLPIHCGVEAPVAVEHQREIVVL